MSRKIVTAFSMLFAASSAWAQSPAPASSPAPVPQIATPDPATTSRVISRFGSKRKARAAQAQVAPGERMQEMESTLNGMHALLKKMQASNASSRSKDPVAKANLEMWELLLTHLDKQFHELQVAAASQEDVATRRTALYNQALAKAAAEAAAARQAPPAPSSSAAPQPNPQNP
ncbi:MAG TPA: hypothetical protein VHM93_09825 [Candidatus Acidoferrum sp.]|jgi:hypothetical protein|nr:hypothetical protein [Candidatus Acidoferrum sp.]